MQPNEPEQNPNIVPTPARPANPMAQPQSDQPLAGQYTQPQSFSPVYANNNMPKKSKTKKAIIAFFVLLLLLGGISLADKFLLKSTKEKGSSKSSTKVESKGPVTADNLGDYEASCEGVKVTNAAAYAGLAPHPIVFMQQNQSVSGGYTEFIPLFKNNRTAQADFENPTAVQLVGCLTVKNTQKSKTCEMKQSDVLTNVDYYSVTYELDIYEAKSNKKLGTKSVTGTADKCPFIASVSKEDPKILADPDDSQVESAVLEYITVNL